MARHFDLLTEPVRDNSRSVARAQVTFAGARDFSVRVAKAIEPWFEIENTTFDEKYLAVHVKRIGASQVGIRFSAVVTCNTDDGVMQRDELLDGYWPPPNADLFVASTRVSKKSRPTLPLFLSPDGR